MKNRLLRIGRVGVLALALPIAGGCVQNSASTSPTVGVQPTNVAAVVTNSPSVATNAAAVTDVVEIAENAPPERVEPAPGSDQRPLPADLNLSPRATEIVKLAQGGVNDAVMLSFVTNTTGTFNLGSDQVIYLKDLGVADEVVTAMIEHDRWLRQGGVSFATAASPSVPAVTDAAAVAAAAAPQALPGAVEATTDAPPAAVATEAVPAPAATVTYNYFYDSLSPYGTWLDVDGYGYCWQPSTVVLDPAWRPYSHGGRWVYSDYGWYWYSDYSWGWAPFHYGRWFSHPRWGWCWRPDTVWGPAWVSWRYNDLHCGWAPLPPAAVYGGVGFTYYGSSVGYGYGFGLGWSSFTFVSWNHFHDHGHHNHCLPPHEKQHAYERSRAVTHVEKRGQHLYNHGVDPGQVKQYTRTEVRPVRVREVTALESGRSGPGERLERGGKELVIRRPRIPETPATLVGRSASQAPRSSPRMTPSAFTERSTAMSPTDRQVRETRPTAARAQSSPATEPKSVVSPAGRRQEPAVERARPTATVSPGGATAAAPMTAARPTISTPSAPASSQTIAPSPRSATPTASSVTVIGRRETRSSATTQATPATRPSLTTTWTRSTQSRPNVAMNNSPMTMTPAQVAPQSTVPQASRAERPVARPFGNSAPQMSARPTPQMSAPSVPQMTAPSSPRSFTPSAPAARSEVRFSTPSPAPSAPAPQMSSRPAPSAAPSTPSVSPSPRTESRPSAPANSSGRSGRPGFPGR